MEFPNPFARSKPGIRKTKRTLSTFANAAPIEEEPVVVDLENDARQRASDVYQDYNTREYVTGSYGQVLRSIRDKQQKACEEAKKTIVQDPQYGSSIWVLIEKEFPCPLGMMPEEEAEKLGTIIPPESWSEIIESRKGGGNMFRSIFINVFFTDEKQYHVKPKFIRKEFTNDELSRLIKDSITLPFEKRYLENNPKAMNAMIKTIQGVSKMLKEKINAAVLQHAKKYWSNNNKNYFFVPCILFLLYLEMLCARIV